MTRERVTPSCFAIRSSSALMGLFTHPAAMTVWRLVERLRGGADVGCGGRVRIPYSTGDGSDEALRTRRGALLSCPTRPVGCLVFVRKALWRKMLCRL